VVGGFHGFNVDFGGLEVEVVNKGRELRSGAKKTRRASNLIHEQKKDAHVEPSVMPYRPQQCIPNGQINHFLTRHSPIR